MIIENTVTNTVHEIFNVLEEKQKSSSQNLLDCYFFYE